MVMGWRVKTSNEGGSKHMPNANTILLVDDDDLVRKLVSSILQRTGFKVLEASDGPMALDVAAQFGGDIDVLLTDVIMPQMPGLQLAVALKRSRPDVKIVLMSGGHIENVGDQGYQWPLLRKPFRTADVIGKLHEVLQEQTEAASV